MQRQPGVKFTLDAGEVGWVNFVLRVGGLEFVASVSEISDPLSLALAAALEMACGYWSAGWVFDLEPGELRVRLERDRQDREQLSVTISEAEHFRLPEAEVVFRAQCEADAFARAVAEEAAEILEKVGPQGFHDRWSFRFPLRRLIALQAALATPEPATTQRLDGPIVRIIIHE